LLFTICLFEVYDIVVIMSTSVENTQQIVTPKKKNLKGKVSNNVFCYKLLQIILTIFLLIRVNNKLTK